jgi:hypothetical protein
MAAERLIVERDGQRARDQLGQAFTPARYQA